MKNEFSFLYPLPRIVRFVGGSLDIRSLCFPLEICKKFDFLFEYFHVRSRALGLEVILQERRDLAGEEYVIDCDANGIRLSAHSLRGQFYALSTLMQVLAFHEGSGRLPAFSLRDAPEIPFRGFMFPGVEGAIPSAAELQRLLLKLALLKFNHLALPAACCRDRGPREVAGGSDWEAFTGLVRKTGMELICIDPDDQSLFSIGHDLARDGRFPSSPVHRAAAASRMDPARNGWFTFFMDQYCLNRSQREKTVAWSGNFVRHPDWIRKIPQDVLILNREAGGERSDAFGAAVIPFARHHISQVLCPTLCGSGRFIPDSRAAMARIQAAFLVAKGRKLAGVMLASGEEDRCECLFEGAVMLRLQAGCLLWSGKPPAPEAFCHWALGRNEPDLFRVFSFLEQAEHRLPHTHGQYLFEDPVAAVFSRQDDVREIEAHYGKASLYLKKKKIPRNELTDFLNFIQQLYAFIAAKVQFSGRLYSLLDEKGGPDQIHRQAAGLEQGILKLKSLYLELWHKHFLPEGLPRCMNDFTFLHERFQYLRQASRRPAGRENLLAELKNCSPFNSPADSPG